MIVVPQAPQRRPPWSSLTNLRYGVHMRVNVGQAKTDLSRLLARVEAGEDVEIARNGVPVARLVPIEPAGPGATFLGARGTLADRITIGDDFELTDAEIDELFGGDA